MESTDPLLAEISALLDAAEGHDDPERLERTLTDGYARALSLEGERWRLEREIGKLTTTVARGDEASPRELAALLRALKRRDVDIGDLRDKLSHLRRRHSSAVRAPR